MSRFVEVDPVEDFVIKQKFECEKQNNTRCEFGVRFFKK